MSTLLRFKLWYTVDRPTEGWKYSSGFINAEMIEKVFFPPASDNLVLKPSCFISTNQF